MNENPYLNKTALMIIIIFLLSFFFASFCLYFYSGDFTFLGIAIVIMVSIDLMLIARIAESDFTKEKRKQIVNKILVLHILAIPLIWKKLF